MNTAQLTLAFNYADLDSETRIVVQQKTGEIRERIKRSANDLIEIGERLTEVKSRLGHGQFGAWLEAEFSLSYETAHSLMNVAKAFNSVTVTEMDIAHKALYALSAPSVPEPARQEAVALASNGHHVTHKEAKTIIDRHKPEPRPEPVRAAPVIDLYADEDEERQEEVEATEPVDEEPEPDVVDRLNLSAEQAVDDDSDTPEWSFDAYTKISGRCNALLMAIKRRGGLGRMAKGWTKAEARQTKNTCEHFIKLFSGFRDELREVIR
jgi:hypothetical protein